MMIFIPKINKARSTRKMIMYKITFTLIHNPSTYAIEPTEMIMAAMITMMIVAGEADMIDTLDIEII